MWSENRGFLLDRAIFNPAYFKFAWTLVTTPVHSDVTASPLGDAAFTVPDVVLMQAKFAATFVLDTLVLVKDRSLLPVWVRALRQLFTRSPAACMWLCEAFAFRQPWLRRVLLRCPHSSTRTLTVSLLLDCLAVLKPLEEHSYQRRVAVDARDPGVPAHYFSFDPAQPAMPLSPSIQLIDAVVFSLKTDDAAMPQLAQLFELLKGFSELGALEKQYLLTPTVLLHLLQFYTGEVRNTVGGVTNTYAGYKGRPDVVSMVPLLSTVTSLVCSAVLLMDDHPDTLACVDAADLVLSRACLDKILTSSFITRAVLESADLLSTLLCHIAAANMHASASVVTLLVNGAIAATSITITNEFRPTMAVLTAVLLLTDELCLYRIETALPPLFDRMERLIVRQSPSDGLYVFLVSRLLLCLAVKCRAAFDFLAPRRVKWDAWCSLYKEETRRSKAWPSTYIQNRVLPSGAGTGDYYGSPAPAPAPSLHNAYSPAAASFGLPAFYS